MPAENAPNIADWATPKSAATDAARIEYA